MLSCYVYRADLTRVGMIPLLSGSAVIRNNDTSTFALDVDGDNPLVNYEPGWHVAVFEDGAQIIAGRILGDELNGTTDGTDLTLTGESHIGYLSQMITLPTPSSAADKQDQDAYYTAKGASETLIADLVRTHVGQDAQTAWQTPIVVDASQGRGSTASLNSRFKNLLEEVQATATVGQTTFRTWMDGNTIRFSQGVGRDLSRAVRFSQTNGAVGEYTLTRAAPTVTSVLVAGQGEGTARTLQLVNGNANDWGVRALQFQDRRDTDDADELTTAGTETLADGQETASITLNVNETPGLIYGVDYTVGDTVTVQLKDGATITDTVQQAAIEWSENGRAVTLQVGTTPDDTDQPKVVTEVRRLRKALAAITTI